MILRYIQKKTIESKSGIFEGVHHHNKNQLHHHHYLNKEIKKSFQIIPKHMAKRYRAKYDRNLTYDTPSCLFGCSHAVHIQRLSVYNDSYQTKEYDVTKQ